MEKRGWKGDVMEEIGRKEEEEAEVEKDLEGMDKRQKRRKGEEQAA